MFDTSDIFERLATCPFFCQGHVDPSTYETHTTDLDYFAQDGPVALTKVGSTPTVVSLVDLRSPQADFTPMQARNLACQLLFAADVAERAEVPTATEVITRMLAEVLAAKN